MRHVSPRLADLTDRARSLTSAGDLAGARAVLTDALAPVEADPMRASPELADAAALHARLLVTLGDPGAALGWAEFARAAQQRLRGPDDERTIAAAATHAAILHRVGDHTHASHVYAEIVDRLTAVDGPHSARVLAAEADLATAEHAAGNCLSACDRLADAWRRHNEEFGDAAPAGIKMLARLGAMERDCGLDAQAHEHLAFAQELCARYLPGDNLLTVQVAALARAPRSAAHACQAGGGTPVASGVTAVRGPQADAGVPGVTALRQSPDDGYWPPEGPDGSAAELPDGRYSTAMTRQDTDRLLPVHLPRPERVTSRRPVIVAGVVTVGLVAAAAVAAAAMSSGPGDDDAGAGGVPTAPASARGSRPPDTLRTESSEAGPPPAAPGRPPPTGLAITDSAGGVTLAWRYPVGAEGPVLISGGRTGQRRQAFQTLPAGSTTFVVYGLNERADYCFTVSVVYSFDSVSASEPVCTSRG